MDGISADDLLTLRAVARSGRYASAAQELGVNHTTVSRRIAALEARLGDHLLVRASAGWQLTPLGERAVAAADEIAGTLAELAGREREAAGIAGVVRVSATDGMSAYIISPAVARLRRDHPGISVEVVAATRRASQIRSGLDIEIVVGRPQVHRALAERLGEYRLGLYASRAWIAEHGAPASVAELRGRPLVYFIDAMLQVDELDTPRRLLPGMVDAISSTNVFVHVAATRAAGGIGLLPCFMAAEHDDLVRVLPEEVSERLSYWMVARPDSLRQPAVALVAQAIREAVVDARGMLLGEADRSAGARVRAGGGPRPTP